MEDPSALRASDCLAGFRLSQVATQPDGKHIGDEDRIAAPGHLLAGAIERDKALGVPRGLVDGSSILNADGLILRGVGYHQWQTERCDAVPQSLSSDVFEELPLDCEATPRRRDLRSSVLVDVSEIGMEVPGDVIRVR